MALSSPKATLLHAALATISHEVATIDDIIRTPARLPTELLLIIRRHLLSVVTTQLFLDSTRALAKYEADLQLLLCPDCISYNHDIYGPDIWQWQQFSGPCACAQASPADLSRLTSNLQQFVNPHHWLEHHLSLQAARFCVTPPSPQFSIWDVVTDVLHQYHCEPLREDHEDFAAIQGGHFPPNSTSVLYYRRVIEYYGALGHSLSPPDVRIRPLASALRQYESRGIGESGEGGDAFRTQVILRQVTRELGLGLELKDVFSSPREPPLPTLQRSRQGGSDAPMFRSTILLHLYTSPVLQGLIKTYSFVSAVLGAFVSMPMTVATIALTVICFYSRPVAFRVGI